MYCKLYRTAQSNIFSHSADWSADAHRRKSKYRLLSDKRASILKYKFIFISFKRLNSITDRRHVCRSKNTMSKRNILTCEKISPQAFYIEFHNIEIVYNLPLE